MRKLATIMVATALTVGAGLPAMAIQKTERGVPIHRPVPLVCETPDLSAPLLPFLSGCSLP